MRPNKKDRRPIFTYIITVFNSFIPATVLVLFGSALVFINNETEEQLTALGIYFAAFVFGYLFCLGSSLLYFFLIRKRIFRPRWWSNLSLILLSYLSAPIYASISGSSDYNTEATNHIGTMFMEALCLSFIGFILIALFTRQRAQEDKTRAKRSFNSPLWILLFTLIHYVVFFTESMAMAVSLNNHSILNGKLLNGINQILRSPIYTPLTKDFILTHFRGPMGHIVFLANSLIWGIGLWLLMKHLRSKNQIEPPLLPKETV